MPIEETMFLQAAAIPYRLNGDGRLQVLMTKRRDKSRWGIPKGLIDPGLTPPEAARIESIEEAGVNGQLSAEPVGTFTYTKWGGTCHVSVYLLRVTEVHDSYDEQHFRDRQWFDLADAVELPSRRAITALVESLPGLIHA